MENNETTTEERRCTGSALNDLLSCPFCGHDANILRIDRDIFVACSNCDSHGEWFNDVGKESEKYAVDSWNRRDPIEKLFDKASSMVGHPTEDDLQKFVDWMKIEFRR